jgi:hypothetical protein
MDPVAQPALRAASPQLVLSPFSSSLPSQHQQMLRAHAPHQQPFTGDGTATLRVQYAHAAGDRQTFQAPAPHQQRLTGIAAGNLGVQHAHAANYEDLSFSTGADLGHQGNLQLPAPARAGHILPSQPQQLQLRQLNLHGATPAQQLPVEMHVSQVAYSPYADEAGLSSPDLLGDAARFRPMHMQSMQGANVEDMAHSPQVWDGAHQEQPWQRVSPGRPPTHPHDPFGLLDDSSPVMNTTQGACAWQPHQVDSTSAAGELEDLPELNSSLHVKQRQLQSEQLLPQPVCTSTHGLGNVGSASSYDIDCHAEADTNWQFGLQGNAGMHQGSGALLSSGRQHLDVPSPHISPEYDTQVWTGQRITRQEDHGADVSHAGVNQTYQQTHQTYQHSLGNILIDDHDEGSEDLFSGQRKRKRVRFAPTP